MGLSAPVESVVTVNLRKSEEHLREFIEKPYIPSYIPPHNRVLLVGEKTLATLEKFCGVPTGRAGGKCNLQLPRQLLFK